jgi:hypothetical protein
MVSMNALSKLLCGFHNRGLGAVLLLTLLVAGQAQAQQDTITMLNGDKLTGEIKSMDRGMVRIETDATDTIAVKWDYVAELASEQSFLMTLTSGQRVFGSIDSVSEDSVVSLETRVGRFDVPLLEIVRMAPIEGRFIEQIDMSIDLGYSIAKASNVVQTTAGFDFGYRSPENQVQLNSNFARSSSVDKSDSQRIKVAGLYRRFIQARRWLPVGIAQYERNDELGLRRRLTLGGGMSRYLTDTNERQISFTGGLVASREAATGAADSERSIEAVNALDIQWFRYDSPELDVSTRLQLFERLSGESRTRGNLDLTFRWELIKDFNWGMSVYYSFDSAPENVEASGSDYGVVTTLGWSF